MCIFVVCSTKIRSYSLFEPQEKKIIINKDDVFDKNGIYQPEHVHIELNKDEVVIGDGSSSKIYEVKKNPKWLIRGHFESNMLDINFEKRVTRS
jgi:hypothetical protein